MIDNIKKLYSMLSKKQHRQIAGVGVLILIGAIFELLGVSLIVPLGQAILDKEGTIANETVQWACGLIGFSLTDENFNQFIILLLAAIIAMYVIKNAFLLFLSYVQARFVNMNQFRTVSYMLEEYLNRPYEFYLNADIPTVFRLVDSDVPKVFTILMEYLQLATEVVVSVFLCIFLMTVDFKMIAIMTVILGIMTALILKVMKPKLNRLGRISQDVQSQMGKWRLQSIYGIKDVKVLHKEPFFAENFRKYSQIAGESTSKYSVLNNMPRLLIETMCIASVLGYLIVYILLVGDVSGIMTSVMAFAMAAIRLMPSVNRINSHITNIAFFEPSLNYVYENVDFNDYRNYGEYQNKEESGKAPIRAEGEIRLSGITYSYPQTEKEILTDAGMVIPIGKSVGVMGPSGGGKTTTVDILLGLLRAKRGEITCGGENIFENYPSWLANIGYIPQSIFLTDDSIRQNIAFGVAEEDIDDKRVWAVLEEAQMKEHVEKMPEGLDTKVGDRGIRLSGGQRQRIGIARALYHNPEILVFDEATSALDTETESAIMEAIDSFHGRKTLVIIAHRLRTIENCDIIYSVSDGKITRTKLEQ